MRSRLLRGAGLSPAGAHEAQPGPWLVGSGLADVVPVDDVEAGRGVALEGRGGGQDGLGAAQHGSVGEGAGGEADVSVRSLVVVVGDRDAVAGPEGPHVPLRLGPRRVRSPAL